MIILEFVQAARWFLIGAASLLAVGFTWLAWKHRNTPVAGQPGKTAVRGFRGPFVSIWGSLIVLIAIVLATSTLAPKIIQKVQSKADGTTSRVTLSIAETGYRQ